MHIADVAVPFHRRQTQIVFSFIWFSCRCQLVRRARTYLFMILHSHWSVIADSRRLDGNRNAKQMHKERTPITQPEKKRAERETFFKWMEKDKRSKRASKGRESLGYNLDITIVFALGSIEHQWEQRAKNQLKIEREKRTNRDWRG